MKKLVLLLVLWGCAQAPVQSPVISEPTTTPEVIVLPEVKKYRTPKFNLPATASQEFRDAIMLIEAWANHDEFWKFVASKRTYFKHTGETVGSAIQLFRDQMDKGDVIDIIFYSPWYKSDAVGAWNGVAIRENTQWKMNPYRRAGHILHETTHKYGWYHVGNYTNKHDNVNSFPYAVGYDFEEFLIIKSGRQLAELAGE